MKARPAKMSKNVYTLGIPKAECLLKVKGKGKR
jgi:hypothetical protein